MQPTGKKAARTTWVALIHAALVLTASAVPDETNRSDVADWAQRAADDVVASMPVKASSTSKLRGMTPADNEVHGHESAQIRMRQPMHADAETDGHRRLEEWRTVTEDVFDGSLGNFATIGGRDAQLVSERRIRDYLNTGRTAVRLRDDSGSESSVFHRNGHDVSVFDELRVSFWFYATGVDDDEKLLLEYSANDGRSWKVVRQYRKGPDDLSGGTFVNNKKYNPVVTFSDGFDLDATEAKLRIRCDASDNSDVIYIDDVTFQGRLKKAFTEPDSPPASEPTSLPTSVSMLDDRAEGNDPTSHPTNAPVSPVSNPRGGLDAAAICPIRRQNPPEKYNIQPYNGPKTYNTVQNDFTELSYIGFSTQKDAAGNTYGYAASDKEQFSLKVIKFEDHPPNSQRFTFYHGIGEVAATYTLNIDKPRNDDWEAIALGPCTDTDTSVYKTNETCIYIGNVGNNKRSGQSRRRVISVFKFVEPSILPSGPVSQKVDVATIKVYYDARFSRTKYDAEAMFADWSGDDAVFDDNKGDLYIITKDGGCAGGVAKIPVSVHKDLAPGKKSDDYGMRNVVNDPPPQLDYTCRDKLHKDWTGADMRRDGRLIAMIRRSSPPGVLFFPRLPGQSVADTLNKPGCDYVSPTSFGLSGETQFEAVAFMDEAGTQLAELSECGGRNCRTPMTRHELVYMNTFVAATVVAPRTGWTTITFDTFENNSNRWGTYKPGGRHATVSGSSDTTDDDSCNGLCACSGTHAAQLADDRGTNSAMWHKRRYDCRDYDWLRVSFKFKFRAADFLDTFFAEISFDGGSDYFIIGDWSLGTFGLENERCYHGEVTVEPHQFSGMSNFGRDVMLRFRHMGDDSKDRVYLDDIRFEGHVAAGLGMS